jgi:membrane-associated phospholipid phosphatase
VICSGMLTALALGRAYLRERARYEQALAMRRAVRSTLLGVRDFLPLVVALALYGCMHDLTPVLRSKTADAALIAIDQWLFGVDLSVWLGRFATPALTEIMVFCYVSFFFASGLLATILYWKGERRHFRDYLVSLCCVTALGYAGYLAVPAVGPYVYQSALFPNSLPGSEAIQRFIQTLDDVHGLARDCFPSLHTAATICVLIFAWRYSRRFFVAYLPIALGLFVSTLYLRYHYGVDVIAGFATAALGTALGPRIERAWTPVSKPDATVSTAKQDEGVLTSADRLA